MTGKKYPVFEIDTYFSTYGMEYHLVGAESIDDLREHLEEIFKEYGFNSSQFKQLKGVECENDDDCCLNCDRIQQIPGLYTDEPYKILTSYGYSE